MRFGGGDQPARIAPVERGLDADQTRQEPARCRFGNDPAAREDEAVAGVVARQPGIHRQRHRRADADRGAIDGTQDGLFRFEDAQRHAAAAIADQRVRPVDRAVFADRAGRGAVGQQRLLVGALVIIESRGARAQVCLLYTSRCV